MDVVLNDGVLGPGARLRLPRTHAVPSHVPTGAALAALRLSEEARGLRGLDVLRRSVDRAPPVPA
jgi:hypothetical protein